MKTRQEIKEQAKIQFSNHYWVSVAAMLLIGICMLAIGGITLGLGTFFLYPSLTIGLSYFSLETYRGHTPNIESIFVNGFSNYGRKLGGYLWMQLFVFLWSLLFIIPGVVKAFSYFMTPYILADCPNVTATDALKISMRMTKGYKFEIFIMILSFWGWMILSVCTLGLLGIFYTTPYTNISFSGLYEELKNKALAIGAVDASELA